MSNKATVRRFQDPPAPATWRSSPGRSMRSPRPTC